MGAGPGRHIALMGFFQIGVGASAPIPLYVVPPLETLTSEVNGCSQYSGFVKIGSIVAPGHTFVGVFGLSL